MYFYNLKNLHNILKIKYILFPNLTISMEHIIFIPIEVIIINESKQSRSQKNYQEKNGQISDQGKRNEKGFYLLKKEKEER